MNLSAIQSFANVPAVAQVSLAEGMNASTELQINAVVADARCECPAPKTELPGSRHATVSIPRAGLELSDGQTQTELPSEGLSSSPPALQQRALPDPRMRLGRDRNATGGIRFAVRRHHNVLLDPWVLSLPGVPVSPQHHFEVLNTTITQGAALRPLYEPVHSPSLSPVLMDRELPL